MSKDFHIVILFVIGYKGYLRQFMEGVVCELQYIKVIVSWDQITTALVRRIRRG